MIRSLLTGVLLLAVTPIASADVTLLNVSYDVTREFRDSVSAIDPADH